MHYQPRGICASSIDFEIEGDMIKSVTFTGGCDGNHKGISQLIKGMKVEEAISRLKGIRCGMRPTSCPDQLAVALETYMQSR